MKKNENLKERGAFRVPFHFFFFKDLIKNYCFSSEKKENAQYRNLKMQNPQSCKKRD